MEFKEFRRRKDGNAFSIFRRIVNGIPGYQAACPAGHSDLEEGFIVWIRQVIFEGGTRNDQGVAINKIKECVDTFLVEIELGTVKNLPIF